MPYNKQINNNLQNNNYRIIDLLYMLKNKFIYQENYTLKIF